MAGTQASRQRLYRELGDLLSQEAVDELMDAIPPVGWGDLARRQDVTTLGHALRGEMSQLRSELHGEMSELRSELRGEMSELRGEMRTEMAHLESSLTAAMRLQLFSMIGAMFTLAGLTWAATAVA